MKWCLVTKDNATVFVVNRMKDTSKVSTRKGV